jgi:hypothetical protein
MNKEDFNKLIEGCQESIKDRIYITRSLKEEG